MIRSFHYNTCCVNYSIKKLKLDAFQIEKILNQLPPEWILRFTEICQRVKITVPCYDYGNDPTLKRKGKEKTRIAGVYWIERKAKRGCEYQGLFIIWRGREPREEYTCKNQNLKWNFSLLFEIMVDHCTICL